MIFFLINGHFIGMAFEDYNILDVKWTVIIMNQKNQKAELTGALK